MPYTQIGPLILETDIVRGAAVVDTANFGETGLEHVVNARNWATVAYRAEIASMFPRNHAGHLAFNCPDPDRWVAKFDLRGNKGDTDRMGLLIRRGGPANERVQCVEIAWGRSGAPLGPPNPINSPLIAELKIAT